MSTSHILWTVSQDTSGITFERLCIDLLYRNGFPRIRPTGGPQDAGRDAETGGIYWKDGEQRPTFFQFSVQDNWKSKLRKDARKLSQSDHEIRHLVFVTPENVAESTKDDLRLEFKDKYNWLLTIFDREWLRFQLEEANPDLTERHLGIEVPTPTNSYALAEPFRRPPDPDVDKAWQLFEDGDYRRATPELHDYLSVNPNSFEAHKALAWCHYMNGHYPDALQSINRALVLKKTDGAKAIRGCILAEHGIQEDNNAAVTEAETIFQDIAQSSDTWTAPYNHGNVQSQLGKYHEAVASYEEALNRNESEARIWKNLGSAYHHLGQHDEEFRCFDRALALDPQNVQALASKGVSCLVDRDDPARAVTLLESALEVDSQIPTRWPYIWYWLGMALHSDGNSREALDRIEEGLRHCPGDEYLIDLRAKVAAEAAHGDAGFNLDAKQALEDQLEVNPADVRALYHLSALQHRTGDDEAAWETILSTFNFESEVAVRELDISLSQAIKAVKFLQAYHTFRHDCPLGMIGLQTEGAVERPEIPQLCDLVWFSDFCVFGLAFEDLLTKSDESTSTVNDDGLGAWIRTLDDIFRPAMRDVARRIGEILRTETPKGATEGALTKHLMGIVGFGALEFQRMAMWIPVRLGVEDEKAYENVVDYSSDRDFEEFHNALLDQVLRAAGIDPDEDQEEEGDT